MRPPVLMQEIDRLFDELVRRPWGASVRSLSPTDIREVRDGWVIELPIPGVRAEDLKIDIYGRRLVISAERSQRQEQRGQGGVVRTQHDMAFEQTIMLPEAAEADTIDASMHGNRLVIRVRRRQP